MMDVSKNIGTMPMEDEDWTLIDSGQILVPVGMPTMAQIPVPNSGGLTISFWTNASSHANPSVFQDIRLALQEMGIANAEIPGKPLTTSTIFVQDAKGKRHLRLDYGVRPDGTINYHWNQKGTTARFGISTHQDAGRPGAALHKFGRVFRHAGRGLIVVGAVLDGVSIYQASNRPRRVAEVVGGWTGAWAGCKTGGAAGAWAGGGIGAGAGSIVPGAGNAAAGGIGVIVGGIGGCIVGGFGGYRLGEWMGGEIYDLSEDALIWAVDTIFTGVEAVPVHELPIHTLANE